MSQAVTQASQSDAQRLTSTSMPQRTVLRRRLGRRAALRQLEQRDAGRERDAGERRAPAQHLPPAAIDVAHRGAPVGATAFAARPAARRSVWHSKQSSLTAA